MAFATFLAVAAVVISALLYYGFDTISGFVRSVAQARASGLTYIYLPFHPRQSAWQIYRAQVLPWILRLPSSWTDSWLPFLLLEQAWHRGYEPFERLGSDTVIAATPGGCVLYSCDPRVNQQICRDNAFDKPTKYLQVLNVFGPTLTASSGAEGKFYRKAVAPFFLEENMRQVWSASICGSEHLTKALTSQNDSHLKLREIMTRYTMGLLSQVAFDMKTDFAKELRFEEDIPLNHKMSYTDAVIKATENLITYFVVPATALREFHRLCAYVCAQAANIKVAKVNPAAYTAKTELLQYIAEMKERKEKDQKLPSATARNNTSLIDLIVDAHIQTRENGEEKYTSAAVAGNVFILNLAGFESSANQMAFMIYVLVCRPQLQRLVQQDLDRVLGDLPTTEWTYEMHFNRLMSSYVGAVIFETLRTFSVIPNNPRLSSEGPETPTVVLDGTTHVPPRGMYCMVNTSATHRNPKYWKTGRRPQKTPVGQQAETAMHEQAPFPLSDFDPSRWLVREKGVTTLLKPEPGSFVAFSEGPRSCLGRRFALIEICAVISVLLKQYTVELVVKPGERMEDVVARAEWTLSAGVQYGHSLRATRNVPVRFVRRAEH